MLTCLSYQERKKGRDFCLCLSQSCTMTLAEKANSKTTTTPLQRSTHTQKSIVRPLISCLFYQDSPSRDKSVGILPAQRCRGSCIGGGGLHTIKGTITS